MNYIKYKYIVALLIVAVIIWLFATLQKILHSPNADLLFNIAFTAFLICGVLAVVKVIFNKDDKFLNK